jgi:hypothetical protein
MQQLLSPILGGQLEEVLQGGHVEDVRQAGRRPGGIVGRVEEDLTVAPEAEQRYCGATGKSLMR